MAKGQARILLHGKQDFLVRSLKEFMTLSEMAECLSKDGLKVSISSLYRYLVSDLDGDYTEYLWHTGRGLLKNRKGRDVGAGVSKKPAEICASVARNKISNPSDLNKFFNNKK